MLEVIVANTRLILNHKYFCEKIPLDANEKASETREYVIAVIKVMNPSFVVNLL